jgi:hypothetical protein
MTELPKWFTNIKKFGKVYLPVYFGTFCVLLISIMVTASRIGNSINDTILSIIGLILLGGVMAALLNPIALFLCALTATAFVTDLFISHSKDPSGTVSRGSLIAIMVVGTIVTCGIGGIGLIYNMDSLLNLLTINH